MRGLVSFLGALVLTACATPAVREDVVADERRMPCDPVATVRVAPRVDGGRVLVEAVLTRQVCEGDDVVEAPVRLAEIRLRPDLPSCPIGQLGARRTALGASVEPVQAGVFSGRPEREQAGLLSALSAFSDDAQAYVIGCPDGRPAEWLFVELPRAGFLERVAFFDGDAVRYAPGHENVVFPAPPPPPPVTPPPPEPPLEAPEAGDESPDAPEPEPPRVTSTGCPGERIDAPWMARRFGSHEQPAPLRQLPGPERVARWWLRLDGGVATLAYEEETRPKHGAGEWTCSEATTVQGAVARSGTKLTLTFGSLVAVCRESSLSLPPANAKRNPKPLPQREDEEGCDRYRWATKARVKTKALVCTGQLPLDALSVFGPPPGIERLVLGNDCLDSSAREALRLVPADGGFAPAL